MKVFFFGGGGGVGLHFKFCQYGLIFKPDTECGPQRRTVWCLPSAVWGVSGIRTWALAFSHVHKRHARLNQKQHQAVCRRHYHVPYHHKSFRLSSPTVRPYHSRILGE